VVAFRGYEKFGKTELADFLESEIRNMLELSEISRLYVVDICLRAVDNSSFFPSPKNEAKHFAMEEILLSALEGMPLPTTRNWRQYGDVLLFRTGYIPESFEDEESWTHHMWVGKKAYQRSIQQLPHEHPAVAIMEELSKKFNLVGRTLTEIRVKGETQKQWTDGELFSIQRLCALRETARIVYGRVLEKYEGKSSLFQPLTH
jgi:hypothetical protein